MLNRGYIHAYDLHACKCINVSNKVTTKCRVSQTNILSLWSILKFPRYGNLARASPLKITVQDYDRANTCFMNYTSQQYNHPCIIIPQGMQHKYFIKISTKTEPHSHLVNMCHHDLTPYFFDKIFVRYTPLPSSKKRLCHQRKAQQTSAKKFPRASLQGLTDYTD